MATVRSIGELPTPSLVVDLDILERNLANMAGRAKRLGVRLRPHIKSHKCLEIARRQQKHDAAGITVSTLTEAEVFAPAGFPDITWAFPWPPGTLARVQALTGRARLGLTVDSKRAVDTLEQAENMISVWLEVDSGDHRCGVAPDGQELVDLAAQITGAKNLRFAGLLTHSGQAYRVRGRDALRAVAEHERAAMVEAAERLRAAGIEVPVVSVGSTPAMSVVQSLEGIDEMRPGNYCFYDRTQVELGACKVDDCALTVLTTVVSSGSDRAVIDAGALSLSMDPGPMPLDGAPPPTTAPVTGPCFGTAYLDYGAARLDRELTVQRLSQEHGQLSQSRPVGMRLRLLPNHACLTAACFNQVAAVRGDRVHAMWKIHRRR